MTGLPVELHIHAGSEADITNSKALGPQLPEGSSQYADAAYTDYALEDAGREGEQAHQPLVLRVVLGQVPAAGEQKGKRGAGKDHVGRAHYRTECRRTRKNEGASVREFHAAN